MSAGNSGVSVGTATVMFTDLVDSTAMRSRIGEDAADALRGVHDAILVDAIVGNGGRVVKHLGDGMMATFGSSVSAVGAAVAIQQSIDLANRRGSHERLQVRIGISVGDVTWEGDDCFGLPVVEARRLEASADPATIRCAELVMHLARGRGGHEFVVLGDLELKGLAEPLAVCEVRWSPTVDADAVVELGLPPVFAHGAGLPFAGRDDVFDQLVDAWKRCAAGGFEVVLLAGEPGIGKTRLAQELATRVHGGNGVVLGGRSDEDVAVPFQAFGSALEWYVRQLEPGDRLVALGEHPGDLVRLVPELGRLVEDLPAALDGEPDVERYRLFQAVGSWLSVGGAERPRLIVLDDLHWADKPTLLLLRHLTANPPAGLLILCTYRDTDVDRTHPLSSMLADFRRSPAVTRLALDGLGEQGVRDLLVRTGGHDLDAVGLVFAERVQRETSGNPFFLGEVLRHLTETGALYERDGRWVSDLSPEEAGIPEGIREVVGRRLSRLGDDVEAVLRSAAVIGYEFDIDLLADVVGRDVDDVLDALDTAARANLVIELGVDRHRFAHALVRETLHAELSATRRARHHRKVAEVLEARHADDLDAVVTELATHWAEASAGGDPTRAIELAIRAGEQAGERGAYENAATWYARTIELMEGDSGFDADRRRLLVRLAESQAESGAATEARTHALDAARSALAAGDTEVVCDALAVVSRPSFVDTDPADPEKIELLGEVLAMNGLTAAQRGALLAQLATEYIFVADLAGRRRAQTELFELLPTLPADVGGPILSAALPMKLDHARASELVTIMTSAARQIAPSRSGRTWSNLFYYALFAGDRSLADEANRQIRRRAAGSTNRFSAFANMNDAMQQAMDGDIGGALASARSMDDAMRAIELPELANYHTSTRVMIRRELGEVGTLGDIADVAEQLGQPAGGARAVAAFIRLHEGNLDGAATALDLVRGKEFSDGPGYGLSVALWSEVAMATRSPDMCRTFADEIAGQSGVHYVTGGIYLGAADRVRARLHDVLGEPDIADELFARAAGQHEAMRTPTWVARTHLDWAESMLVRGRGDDARSHLDAARIAIGDLVLPESQARLDDLTERAITRS